MKAREANIKKLQALGYGKKKASAALKDSGGNYDLAIKILNNLEAQVEQQKQRQRAAQTKGTGGVVERPQATATAESPPADKQRTHPCLVQYKKCQYGRYCLLRDYPGDTCINYFNGTCLYGSYCMRQHYVDGVDIRSDRREYIDDSTMKLPTGEIITRSQVCGNRVYVGKVIQPAPQQEPAWVPPPAPSRFNLIMGAEASHTDPLVSALFEESCIPTNVPQPFLDAVRRAPESQNEREKECSTIRVTGQVSDASGRTEDSVSGSAKHPCLAQFGSCRFGKDCIHADRDADVCVYYLNSHCTRGARCPHRHESSAACVRRARPDVWGGSEEPLPVPHVPVEAEPRSPHTSLAEAEAHPAPVLLSSFLPEAGAGRAAETADSAAREGLCDDAELAALVGLFEAFPQVEPLLLLQALRTAGGDAELVADAMSRLDAFESVEAMNAFLWNERAVEEESLEENALRSRHESLLTLCSLFPAVDVPSIEAALERCRGDYAEAYGILLCSRENITRTAYGNAWCGAIKPADELRVAKLGVMFPTLPREILRTTFGAADSNFTRTVTVLNEITRDLLHSPGCAAEKPHATGGTATAAHVPAHLLQGSATSEDISKFRTEVEAELREAGDWRRVREKAYIVNACRLHVLSQASAAYLRGDGKTAKTLSRDGKALGAEYVRLNRVAMIALEQERLAAQPASTLDLHGFHVDEAMEVLRRRVKLCVKKGIQRLTIVVGRGLHSQRGQSKIYPVVLEQLQYDPQLKDTAVLRSVKPAYFEVVIKKNGIR